MTETLYLLLGAVWVGYFALAGYDYGTGILLRAVAGTDRDRRLVLGALGPFLLGNEVWLVAGLGLLLGAFPLADGPLLSGLYPLLIPVIVALMLFVAVVQLRSRFGAGRAAMDWIVVGSAATAAFGWGAVFGALLEGLPLRWSPLPILTGLTTVALFTLHGAGLLVLRTPDPVRSRAARVVASLSGPAAVLTVAAAGTAALRGDAVTRPWPAVALTGLLLLAVGATRAAHRRGRPGWGLLASGLAAALPVIITGVATLPYLVAHRDPARAVTVTEAAAGGAAQGFLLTTVIPVLPVLLLFQAVTWWLWRRTPRGPSFY